MRLILKSLVMMVCAVFVFSGTGLAGSVLQMTPQKASSGEMVTLPLILQSDTQLAALSVDVSYPADELRFEYAEIGTAAVSKRVVSTVREEGLLRVGLLSMDRSLIDNGEVVVLTFSIDPEAAPGVIRLRLKPSGASPDGAEVKMAMRPGRIQVSF